MLSLLNTLFMPPPTRDAEREAAARAQRYLQVALEEGGRATTERSQQDFRDALVYGFAPLHLLSTDVFSASRSIDEEARIAVEGESAMPRRTKNIAER